MFACLSVRAFAHLAPFRHLQFVSHYFSLEQIPHRSLHGCNLRCILFCSMHSRPNLRLQFALYHFFVGQVCNRISNVYHTAWVLGKHLRLNAYVSSSLSLLLATHHVHGKVARPQLGVRDFQNAHTYFSTYIYVLGHAQLVATFIRLSGVLAKSRSGLRDSLSQDAQPVCVG